MPSANMASLTMYSRSTGPSAARPSPRRENGVGPRTLQLDVAARPVLVDDLAEQDGAAVTELGHEVAELVAGIGHGNGIGAFGHALSGQDFRPFRVSSRSGSSPSRRASGRFSLISRGAATGVGATRAKKLSGSAE